MRILLVEDEGDVAATITESLAEVYAIDTVRTGKDGYYRATINEYDCIVIDLGLPDMDGLELCKSIRTEKISAPILILTGRDFIDQKVHAFDLGADDYLVKPFNMAELNARLRALLRRSREAMPDQLTLDSLTVDIAKRTVERNGQPITLRRKEFDLLEYFMRNPGRVLTRTMILEHVWNDDMDPFTNAIDVHIKYLRDAIDRPFNQKLIKTIHGLGYKIEA